MKILDIYNITRVDETTIYYLRTYNAIAKIKLPIQTVNLGINFTIESTPLGIPNISIRYHASIDYPLQPLTRRLSSYIKEVDSEGILP
ncbi:MAG TPA: hypothetical protein VFC68_06275 [Treponemataceae bacterium]|nr:hypothetical protein [Treponemataceae bacterium]